jgi:hypothetical protein
MINNDEALDIQGTIIKSTTQSKNTKISPEFKSENTRQNSKMAEYKEFLCVLNFILRVKLNQSCLTWL